MRQQPELSPHEIQLNKIREHVRRSKAITISKAQEWRFPKSTLPPITDPLIDHAVADIEYLLNYIETNCTNKTNETTNDAKPNS